MIASERGTMSLSVYAAHEAGHCYMLHLLGQTCDVATIVPSGDETVINGVVYKHAGHVMHKRLEPTLFRLVGAFSELDAAIMVALAGGIGEGLVTGRRDPEHEGADQDKALRLARQVCDGESAARAYVQRLEKRVRIMLDTSRGRRVIGALAVALETKGTLSGDECEMICKRFGY